MNKDIVKDNRGNCQLFCQLAQEFFCSPAFSLGYMKKFCKAGRGFLKKKQSNKDTLVLARGGNT